MAEAVIEAQDLCKRYGDLIAIDHVSFRIERGEIVGFLGTNGAGKTTTFRVLAGFLPPTSGTARVAGHDVLRSPRAVKRRIGYLPEHPPVYPEMTVRTYLVFVARIKGLRRAAAREEVDAVMTETGVSHVAHRLIGALSRGFQQRVGIAQALLGRPPVLLLDEPTLGLDPNQMQFVRSLVRKLAQERTVFISTHFLYEVEEVCSRALIIQEGRLVADATLADLTAGLGRVKRLAVGLAATDAATRMRAQTVLEATDGVEGVALDEERPGRLVVTCARGSEVRARIARRLVEEDLPLAELTPLRPRLEEVFLELTSRPLDPARHPGRTQVTP